MAFGRPFGHQTQNQTNAIPTSLMMLKSVRFAMQYGGFWKKVNSSCKTLTAVEPVHKSPRVFCVKRNLNGAKVSIQNRTDPFASLMC